jgi:hypothetical protein
VDWEAVLAIAITFGSLTATVFGVLYAIRKYGDCGENALDRIYWECGFPCEPGLDDVEIVYYTYHGLLVGVREEKHIVLACPEMAKELLRRLRNFNLTWGMLAYGGLIMVIPTFVSYYIQLRKIEQQVRAMESV